MTDTLVDDTPGYRISYHRNDDGDWCPFSLVTTTHTAPADDDRCPQRCRDSSIEPNTPDH